MKTPFASRDLSGLNCRNIPGFFLVVFFAALCLSSVVAAAEHSANTLWYAQPAAKWTEALPIGNGHLGAMIFGGVTSERIQFNEDTLWRGQPHDYVRVGAADQLAEIRRLVFAGKSDEAEKLAKEKAISDPVRQMPYQPFGDLRFQFPDPQNLKDYRRELDLASAIATTTYRLGAVTFKREAFASYPDRVIVVRLTASRPGQINFTLHMDSPHPDSQTIQVGDELRLSGQISTNGLRFESRGRLLNDGGRVITNADSLTVSNADAVTLELVARTSFLNFQDISGDPAGECAADLKRIARKTFAELRATHLADYQNLFNRVSLKLGRTAAADLPTDERQELLKSAGLTNDPALVALYFQYGRYLLIASSRPGSQPANLQGVWNEELNPPWESKYTLNINAEMNYWPAEVCNLSETHEPLFDMIDDLVISGGRAAREQYGARGWVVHHNTDLWRGAAPINNVDGFWPTGGAWLCQHLWERYLFTGDTNFLKWRAYPVMKGAALFFVDFLVKDPATGYLVTCPSHSPEQTPPNRPLFVAGPTMDNQLIRSLFTHTIEAAEKLNTDKDFVKQLTELRSQLPPNKVGSHGQLQEWQEDWDAPNNNHRHMSPLWGLFPGHDITPAQTNIFAAAKVLLKWRGDGSTGWSYAWRMPLWARVGDGEMAFRQLAGLLQRRTLPNLFDLCGPFQIDGNFGACAGIAEMLLQSQNTETSGGKPDVRVIDLLPALPEAWPTGSVTGLCARGGFVIDIAWQNRVLTKVVVRSKLGQPYVLRYGKKEIRRDSQPGGREVFDGKLNLAVSHN